MEPCAFDESNTIIGPPPGLTEEQVRSVYGHKSNGMVITCWKPNQEEVECLMNGEPLWLVIWGNTIPPVILTTESPFES